MSLCLAAGGKTVSLAVGAFMLAWTHSVEKIEWQEDWQVDDSGLVLVEARVKGSGAGMEPPADARFADGWWHYTPTTGSLPQLILARSGATGAPWRLCFGAHCQPIDDLVGPGTVAVTVSSCAR